MQKKMNVKTVGAVHIHTPYLYKISVQAKGSNLENKKIINTDKTKNL